MGVGGEGGGGGEVLFFLTKPKFVNISVSELKTQESCYNIMKIHYSNILKISPPNTERFQIKILTFSIFLLKT